MMKRALSRENTYQKQGRQLREKKKKKKKRTKRREHRLDRRQTYRIFALYSTRAARLALDALPPQGLDVGRQLGRELQAGRVPCRGDINKRRGLANCHFAATLDWVKK